MVMTTKRKRWIKAVSGLMMVALMTLGTAEASVIASVDRSDIELNESFTLKITVDTAIDTEPDASALDADFYVGTRSQLSNTTIVNGQISRSRTWTYVLMAKREGNLEIPPVIIGAERSEAVPINVSAPSNALPGEADIFVTTEVDHTDSFVQAQLIYTVKVYRSVATRQPRLSEPDISGVEVLIESRRKAGRLRLLRRDSKREFCATGGSRAARFLNPKRSMLSLIRFHRRPTAILTQSGFRRAM